MFDLSTECVSLSEGIVSSKMHMTLFYLAHCQLTVVRFTTDLSCLYFILLVKSQEKKHLFEILFFLFLFFCLSCRS